MPPTAPVTRGGTWARRDLGAACLKAYGQRTPSNPLILRGDGRIGRALKRNISAPAPAAAPDAMDFRPPIGHGAARAETAGIRDL